MSDDLVIISIILKALKGLYDQLFALFPTGINAGANSLFILWITQCFPMGTTSWQGGELNELDKMRRGFSPGMYSR